MQHVYTKYHEAGSTMIHTHSMSNEVSMTFLRCNVFLEAYTNNIHIPSLQVRNQNPFVLEVLEALLIEDYRVNFCSGMRGLIKPISTGNFKSYHEDVLWGMMAGCSKRYPSASGMKKQQTNWKDSAKGLQVRRSNHPARQLSERSPRHWTPSSLDALSQHLHFVASTDIHDAWDFSTIQKPINNPSVPYMIKTNINFRKMARGWWL